MRIHSRWITVGVAAALLTLVGVSLATAQQPQAPDTARETGAVTPTADNGSVSKQGAEGFQYTGPATDTALKARPGVQTGQRPDNSRPMGTSDTLTAPTRGVSKQGAQGYHYRGASSDTALHARPGTQTGPATTHSGKALRPPRQHYRAAPDSTRSRADSTRSRADSTP
jgi:hypothetical protein